MSLRERIEAARFRRRWGFTPPPAWSDWVGYEHLLEEIERHDVARVAGDLLEIGAFLGGGTAKLCDWCALHAADKRVITVDIFDPEFDPTTTVEGWTMAGLYGSALQGRAQRSIFDEVTRARQNLIVLEGDSAAIQLPAERLAFAFVDGSHVPEQVRSDFELVWDRLSTGGIAAFHDYGGNLPGVTTTLHECIGVHAAQIARVWTRSPMLLFVQRN